MLGWVVTFLIIALIAALLGFGGIAGAAVEMAKLAIFTIRRQVQHAKALPFAEGPRVPFHRPLLACRGASPLAAKHLLTASVPKSTDRQSPPVAVAEAFAKLIDSALRYTHQPT